MKNEKIVEVCQIIIKVCNIAVVIAQTVAQAFAIKSLPAAQGVQQQYSQEDIKLIKEFLEQEHK